MRVQVQTVLHAPMERIWRAMQTPRILAHICAPLIVFRPLTPWALDAPFPDGRIRVWMWLFGFIPMGRQWINVSRLEASASDHRVLLDDGTGDLATVWRHTITLRALSADTTAYTDEVTVKAGLLTPLVWAFAAMLYRWRQARWRGLIARNQAPL